MSDLIDREKAIEQMSLYGSVWMDYTDDMTKEQVAEKALRASKQALIEAVKRLPSAQPTFDVRDTQYNLPIGTDLISRQAAIDTLENTKTAISEIGERYIAKQNAIMRIDALPAAQPKRGKCKWCEKLKERNLRIEYYWIDKEGCTASFSEPHVVATGIANYCPNCGAKMEVAT